MKKRTKPVKKKLSEAEKSLLKELKTEEKEVLRSKKQKENEEEISYEPTVNIGDLIEIKFDEEELEPIEGISETVRGKVLNIYYDKPVPDIDEEVEGTHSNPAVLLEIYTVVNDKWKPTGKLIAYKMSDLKRAIISYKEKA